MRTGDGVFVIAEAGVNHNGDLETARHLIDAAAQAGADAVKFQSFRAGELVSRSAPKADYQLRTTDAAESQHDMIEALELTEADHAVLIDHAGSRGIDFLSTPFDLASLALLTDRFGLGTIKLGSGELTNGPLLLAAARSAQELIVSTGMGCLGEVESALSVLAFGFVEPLTAVPSPDAVERAYGSETGQQALRDRVTLLHCTTDYPADVRDVNLRAMATLERAFGVGVGYSDHTMGIHVSLAAVAAGATVIEKHVTLDRGLPGPDHEASLEPDELRELVHQLREVEQSLGDGIKRPAAAEQGNRDVARKSLVAKTSIRAGERYDTGNLTCKRPGTGVSPLRYWDYLGQPADRDYDADDLIR